MLVALTGTPGTGKSSVGRVLEARGYAIMDLDELARRNGLVKGRDRKRKADEIDIDALREHIRVPAKSSKLAFLKSHYSHMMDVYHVVVLRCRPSVLRERLRARGWPAEKIREIVEAEALDVITQEAVGRTAWVSEIDTTDIQPEEAAAQVLAILQGQTEGHEPGRIDWTEEALTWS